MRTPHSRQNRSRQGSTSSLDRIERPGSRASSRRGSNDPAHCIDTELLRSDPKIFTKKTKVEKDTRKPFDYQHYAALKDGAIEERE